MGYVIDGLPELRRRLGKSAACNAANIWLRKGNGAAPNVQDIALITYEPIATERVSTDRLKDRTNNMIPLQRKFCRPPNVQWVYTPYERLFISSSDSRNTPASFLRQSCVYFFSCLIVSQINEVDMKSLLTTEFGCLAHAACPWRRSACQSSHA